MWEALMRPDGFLVVLLGAVAACSGSSNTGGSLDGGLGGGLPAACTAFAACGGNIVGTWHITAYCGPGASQTQPVMGCAGGTVKGTFTATGTAVFNADSTYTATTTATGSETALIPNSCLTGTTCADVQNNLVNGPVMSATCTSDNTNCTCSLVLAPQTQTTMGTYAVTGTTLTTTPNDGSMADSSPYCVSGNQLSIQSTDTNGMSLVLVATK